MSDRSPPSQETIFADALALPAEARAAFVERACAGDRWLAEQVNGLLRGYEEDSGFLESPLMEAEPASVSATDAPPGPGLEPGPGDRIGPYKLLERIGEGAAGIVYMAEQERSVRRRVALKLIRLGLDTREFVARFEAERQALALMEHPNIAKVFDAGATAQGRPYFVMELVRGLPITRYCDENRLSPADRLALFIQVCQAIQHAHQKGVIHRDLKPSNILVATDGGEASPKVIDFGIAKATQGQLTDKTLFTRMHAFIGTPAYSSPEQAEVTNLDVDTRSDIYSLGVLLYELLTGHPPVDASTIEQMSFEELRRTIREVEPARPSARVSRLGLEDRTNIARRRSVDPARLALLLRSDLDWIVMRCLEKDRRRRYETASALAQDLRRFLDHEPVEARPPSVAYRLHKFAGRHRAAVLAAGGIAAAIVAGLIVSSVLLVRERAARARAVEAERVEGEMRAEAEAGRLREIRRSARAALNLSEQLLKEGRTADGIAYLVHAARRDPENTAIAARLAYVLTSRNFLLPEHAPYACGSRVIALRYTLDGRSLQVGTEDGTLRVFDAATGAVAREVRLGRAVKRNGWVFPRDDDRLCSVRFVGDTLGVLDIASGQLRFPAVALDPRVRPGEGFEPSDLDAGTVRMSPDGRWVLADGWGGIWIWDAATGAAVVEQDFPGLQFCVLNHRGDRFAEVADDALTVWSLPEFARISGPVPIARNVAPPRTSFLTAHFSGDGREVIVVDGWEAFHVIDAETGELRRWIAHGGTTNWILPGLQQVLPDGRLFVERSGSSELWDLETGASRTLSFSGWRNLKSAAIDTSGERILMTTAAGFARLVSTATGEKLAEDAALHESGDVVATLSPDGTQIAAGTGGGELRWLRAGRGAARPLEVPAMAAGFTTAATPQVRAISPTESRVIDVRTGRDVVAPAANPSNLSKFSWSLSLSPGARFLLWPDRLPEGEAWDYAGGGAPRVVRLEGVSDRHFHEFSPEGDRDVYWDLPRHRFGVRDLATGRFVGPVVSCGDEIRDGWNIRLDTGGRRVVTGFSNGVVAVWDSGTGQRVTTLQETGRASPLVIEFSPDGTRLVVSTAWGEARVWDSTTGQPVSPPFEVVRGGANSAVPAGALFSPDGRWLATVSERGLTLRDATTFAPVLGPIPFVRPPAGVLHFSRDGTRLGEGLKIWDIPSGERIMDPTDEHSLPGGVRGWGFSADARYLLYRVVLPGGMAARVRAVPPRLPDGAAIPDWLLRLADAVSARTINEAEECVGHPAAAAGMETVRRELARLPDDAPYVEWGRWILDDRPDRPIAPGFSVTPAEADRLAARPVAWSAAE